MIMSKIMSIFKQPVMHRKYHIVCGRKYFEGVYFPNNIFNDEPKIYYNYIIKEYTDIRNCYFNNKLEKGDKVLINNNLFNVNEVASTEGGYVYILDEPIEKIDNEPDEVIWREYYEKLIKYYNEKIINENSNIKTKKIWWQFWK
jgi:hypothetical protein